MPKSPVFQLLATLISTALFLLVPGTVVLRRAGASATVALYLGPLLMIAMAAAVAAAAVVLPFSPYGVAPVALVGVAALSVWAWATAPRPVFAPRADWGGVLVWALLFVACTLYLAVPSQPAFEPTASTIAPGRVETPRLAGRPSDSHLPYRTGQLAVHKLGGEALRDGFHPGWWLSDRAPLNGLVFAFAVTASQYPLPAVDPIVLSDEDNQMGFMDDQGYWLYYLVSAAIGTAGVLGVYLLGTQVFGRRAGRVGAGLFALMPGVFLYALYPRPSLVLVYPALVALALALARRPVAAGLAAGLCALAHPSGAVWVLAAGLAVWWVSDMPRWRPVAALGAAAAVLVAPWQLFTTFVIGGSSRLLTWPLGQKLADPHQPLDGLREAWGVWVAAGIDRAVWTRVVSLTRSVIPGGLFSMPDDIGERWSLIHQGALFGLVGFVLFPAVIVAVVRLSPELRRLIISVVVLVVAVTMVAEGIAEPFIIQGLLPLLGLGAVVLAPELYRWRPVVATGVILVAAVELASVVWSPAVFAPVGLGGPTLVVLAGGSAVAQVALVAVVLLWVGGARRAEEAALEPPAGVGRVGPAPPEAGGARPARVPLLPS
jgi:hypothetical protein